MSKYLKNYCKLLNALAELIRNDAVRDFEIVERNGKVVLIELWLEENDELS